MITISARRSTTRPACRHPAPAVIRESVAQPCSQHDQPGVELNCRRLMNSYCCQAIRVLSFAAERRTKRSCSRVRSCVFQRMADRTQDDHQLKVVTTARGYLGLSVPTREAGHGWWALRIRSEQMGRLVDALAHVYRVLGFEDVTGRDKVPSAGAGRDVPGERASRRPHYRARACRRCISAGSRRRRRCRAVLLVPMPHGTAVCLVPVSGRRHFASALGHRSTSGGSQGSHPLATLFAQASFCADRICMSPPLSVTIRLTGGEHHGSFR